jgi:Skp family chaperone for outer membrane proteins
MKKNFFFSIILLAIAPFYTTFAQSATSTQIQAKEIEMRQNLQNAQSEIDAHKQDIQNNLAKVTADIQNKKADLASDIQKRIGKSLDPQRTAIAQKFEDTVKNINDLIDRLQSRITELQASSTDTTVAQASLDTAKTNLDMAQTDLAILENMLAEPIATSTRKETITTIQSASNKTKNDIETAYGSFMKALDSLSTEAGAPSQRDTRIIMQAQINHATTTQK